MLFLFGTIAAGIWFFLAGFYGGLTGKPKDPEPQPKQQYYSSYDPLRPSFFSRMFNSLFSFVVIVVWIVVILAVVKWAFLFLF